MKRIWGKFIGMIVAVYLSLGVQVLIAGNPTTTSKELKMLEYVLIKNDNHLAVDCKEKAVAGKHYIRCDFSVGTLFGLRKKLLFEVRSINNIKAVNGSAKLPELLRYDEISAYEPAVDGVIDVSAVLRQFPMD